MPCTTRLIICRDVGRGLATLGAGAPRQKGLVTQVSASSGGVPKRALLHAVIGRRGLEGDQQAERRHHGRPWQAVCLWSAEVIDDLRAEGHSVHPGAAGENITVSAIDWATIRPGVRVQVGTALTEISSFAEPCSKNARAGSSAGTSGACITGCTRLEPRLRVGARSRCSPSPGDAVVVEP